jgi:hypothetical protein
MQNQTKGTHTMQANTGRLPGLIGIWASLGKLMSGKTSSTPTKLFCEKWRPAGIGVLLTDREQWATMGCQD